MHLPSITTLPRRAVARVPDASPRDDRDAPRDTDAIARVAPADPLSGTRAADTTFAAANLEGIVVGDVAGGSGADAARIGMTLLLKDGRARLGLEGSPLALTPPPADGTPDTLWTRWRAASDGSGYEILDTVAELWARLGGRLFAPKLDPVSGELSGVHARTRTDHLGSTTTTVTERLEFAVDGTFSRSRSALATTAAAALATAGVASVVHVRETASDPARLGGRYSLLADGFTLELVDADGRRERSLLLDDGDARVIGGRRYRYSASDIATIDLHALVQDWAAARPVPVDWREAIGEALARGVERRAVDPAALPSPGSGRAVEPEAGHGPAAVQRPPEATIASSRSRSIGPV